MSTIGLAPDLGELTALFGHCEETSTQISLMCCRNWRTEGDKPDMKLHQQELTELRRNTPRSPSHRRRGAQSMRRKSLIRDTYKPTDLK
ncbi:hypothetical protein F2P79_015536 [Pimephales promelas]|nr:hypothetical protein F2P79_015536 [Pimephales promelas]